ncbi:TIGR03808 family TAT-translocated repetitive protein [Notoacmeibacter sp. MSK16QG-6]|uniref:TIGR03808 family TAT-translocated repetitive protein n=1 Tax=Notoacmeibacter sp. MSK16QG-6 TaxID=2957982 RepID=UPI0020A01430|nr:TIGR03808 family TAT-translocated repetitive protein [Notoacmeibacter sp. MSK16QG-6]MCP1198175.1 TIGR03808 family TAT-translocated repetitive protein [Notoacmeibacter sp. MSK16QG-6]
MLDRRRFISGLGGAAFGLTDLSAAAAARPAEPLLASARLRGGVDAAEFGVRPNATDDQSAVFQRMIDEASRRDLPISLPPGHYPLSNIRLPERVRLSGVPGATRLRYTGRGFLMRAEKTQRVELDGISIDGENRWLSEDSDALIELRIPGSVSITDCDIAGARKTALEMEGATGLIRDNKISGAGAIGLFARQSNGLSIHANIVERCADGGILVHRWQDGEDGTQILGNRISRIGAASGGTGQNGNGINVFRAQNVTIADNFIADCAFSAIRGNGASGMIARGNQCLRSGETALYAEFATTGSIITGNLVDGAANGISSVNFDSGGRLSTISANIVRNLSANGPYEHDSVGFGLGISVEADTAVTGNIVEGAARFGILAGWGPYLRAVTVSDNVIRQAPVGLAVSVADGAKNALITGNMFDQISEGAIVGYRWLERATEDLALLDENEIQSRYAHLNVARNHVG